MSNEVSIKERHDLLCHLFASGYTNRQCAGILEGNGTPLSESYISTLRNAPMLQARTRELMNQHITGTMEAVVAKLFMEQGFTLQRLIELRDQSEDLPVAARAAQFMFTQGMELAGMGKKEDPNSRPTVNITINSDRKASIDAVMAEVIPKVVEYTKPKSVEEALADLPEPEGGHVESAGT